MESQGFTPGRVLAKNALLNLVGMILPILVGIGAIPFAIKGLGKEGFGILSIAWIVLGYFALLDFGLGRATTKFVAEIAGGNNTDDLPAIVWTSVILSVALGLVGTAILFGVTPYLVNSLLKIPPSYIHQASTSFYLAAGSLPFILLSSSSRGVLAAAQRFDLVNLVLVPASILSYLFPALSLPFKLTLQSVILLIVLVRIGASFMYLVLSLRVFPILRRKPLFKSLALRKLLSYGGWITITGVISPVLVYMDRFFIGSILSITAVAFYAAPYDAIHRLRFLPIAVMKTFFPEFSRLSRGAKGDRVEFLVGRATKYLLLPTGTIALVLYYYASDILQLWLGPEFADKATILFKMFALGIVLNSLAYIPFVLLQAVGRPDLPAKFHMVEFPVYVALLWYLTQHFGLTGAASAWLPGLATTWPRSTSSLPVPR
ncbi:MAG: flippase, partial [Fidelibacterota bacterium]